MTSPIRPTDDEARDLARGLVATARIAALGVIDPESHGPMVTRIAVAPDPTGHLIGLVSELSQHTTALKSDPRCSLLIGEPGPKGDPLTHPRLTVMAEAGFVGHGTPDYAELARHYLTHHPKAKLYIGFADFVFLRFKATGAHLNGGFGRAYTLIPADITPAGSD